MLIYPSTLRQWIRTFKKDIIPFKIFTNPFPRHKIKHKTHRYDTQQRSCNSTLNCKKQIEKQIITTPVITNISKNDSSVY